MIVGNTIVGAPNHFIERNDNISSLACDGAGGENKKGSFAVEVILELGVLFLQD